MTGAQDPRQEPEKGSVTWLQGEQVRLERERFELEKQKSERENRFVSRNFGALLAGLLTLLTTVITAAVTVGQIRVAEVQGERDKAMAQENRRQELALAQQSRERDLEIAERNRQLDLEERTRQRLVEFVASNAKTLFPQEADQRARLRQVILATFPAELTKPLFENLETAAGDAAERRQWARARQKAETTQLVAKTEAQVAKASPAQAGSAEQSGKKGQVRSPTAAETAVAGELDPSSIQRIVGANVPRIRRCYEAGLATDPKTPASVRIDAKFTIGENGRVTAAQLVGADASAALKNCVGEAVRAMTFPSPADGTVTVSYPFVFSPAAGD